MDEDEYDDDDAPTAMFVHSVKYSYDPDGPPGQQDDLFDDDDEDEPPTAIHVSPYRGDAPAQGAPGFGQGGPSAPPPGSNAVPDLPPSAGPPPAPPAPAPVAQRFVATRQLEPVALTPPPSTASGVSTGGGRVGGTQVTTPDLAPMWLKAVAIGSVVSAITVLATLVWMIHARM